MYIINLKLRKRNAIIHECLFERFHRRGDSEGSLGLGLAIVKKITDIYDFKINYQFDKGLHHFVISFPDSAQNSTLNLK